MVPKDAQMDPQRLPKSRKMGTRIGKKSMIKFGHDLCRFFQQILGEKMCVFLSYLYRFFVCSASPNEKEALVRINEKQ